MPVCASMILIEFREMRAGCGADECAGGHGALSDIQRMVLCLLDGNLAAQRSAFGTEFRVVFQKSEVKLLWL